MLSTRNIKPLRESKGISLISLATSVGISKSYLSMLENNENRKPNYQILFQIAETLNVSVYELLGQVYKAKNRKVIVTPLPLQQLAVERNSKGNPIPEMHLRTLASFELSNKKPGTKEDYELLYQIGLRICK